VRLQRGPEGAQLVTAPEAAPYVEYFLGLEAQRRLSNAALETLAIVAYRQPVTRATVEAVRGVNSDASIATLRARGLLDEGGRAPGPGRPTLFVTTQRFLEHFGLERPEDLPPLEDLDDHDLPPPDAPLPLPFDEDAEGAEDDGRDDDRPPETPPAAADAAPPLL
jgi:segregation and condensation protein B